MKKVRFFPILLYVLVLILLFSWLLGMFDDTSVRISYSEVITQFESENVSSFEVKGSKLTLQLHEPMSGSWEVVHSLADPEGFHEEIRPLLEQQTKSVDKQTETLDRLNVTIGKLEYRLDNIEKDLTNIKGDISQKSID